MSQTERFYIIDRLLHERTVVSFDTLQSALGVSRATLKRDLEYMRSRLNAPIEWSRAEGGYRFGGAAIGPAYALPGLWFNEREIHALLTMQHLLSSLGADGLLADHVAPLMARLDAMLGADHDTAEKIKRKVLVVGVGRRTLPLQHFQTLGHALLKGVRVQLQYAARSTASTTEREVSPLRLVQYRENWYLDAWCHLRDELRNFSVDKIEMATPSSKPAKKVKQQHIDHALGPGYGIFAQGQVQWATLRFSPYRARWVGNEMWHPEQRMRYDAQGYLLLEVPFTDHRELIMDALRFGADCEVVGPDDLRMELMRVVRGMQELYKK